MKRRDIFAGIAGTLAGIFGRKAKAASVPSESAIYQSFDARDWALGFIQSVKANPSIATDPETLTTWFAGALMRGYDEYPRKMAAGNTTCESELRGAIARGWCHPKNSHKPMDCDLADAIFQELILPPGA